jgi:hypothetical protein
MIDKNGAAPPQFLGRDAMQGTLTLWGRVELWPAEQMARLTESLEANNCPKACYLHSKALREPLALPLDTLPTPLIAAQQ